MSSSTPLVSVVVPAHNAGRWIAECIGSLLSQTVQDVEVIVIDDASSDDTLSVVRAAADSRVVVVANERNIGAAASRNRGIERATGEFLAFMDADDIALPYRFEKQLAFFRAHPDVDMCGGWMQTFGRRSDLWLAQARHEDIKAELLYACGMQQSTVMCRRAAFLRNGLKYDPTIGVSEDYDLWTRSADVLRLANLQEVLVRYRVHGDNQSLTKRERLVATNRMLRLRQLKKLGIEPNEREAEFHDKLFEYGPGGPGTVAFDLDVVEAWLLRLAGANRRSGYVPERNLRTVLYEFWRRCCLGGPGREGFRAGRFLKSKLLDGIPVARRLKDAAKGVLGLPFYPLPRLPE